MKVVKFGFLAMSVFCPFLALVACASINNITIPTELKQNAFNYVANSLNESLLSRDDQQQNLSYFKQQYFYPWSEGAKQELFCYVPGIGESCTSTKDLETGTLSYYEKNTGYNQYYVLHNSNWIDPIRVNMDLENFPNIACSTGLGCKGIMVDNAQVRSLPTDTPFYQDFTTPGEGYPFDYIQLADMWLGTPVQLVQITWDKNWMLVKGQGILGWVPTNSVAFVDSSFVKRWKSSSFVVPTVRKQTISLSNKKSPPRVDLYIGTVLPEINDELLIPYKSEDGEAKTIRIPSDSVLIKGWPLLPNQRNFAHQINALSDMPYGWGGKDFNSDCSGLMRRLFLSFGIWLPRASYWQTNFAGDKYSLYGKTPEQRKAIIIEHNGNITPKPFLTLISFGDAENKTSHIGLYMGTSTYNGNPIAVMFHAHWGVKMQNVENYNLTGRALIAKSLISPVGVGDSLHEGLLTKGWDSESLWDAIAMNLTFINYSSPRQNELAESDELEGSNQFVDAVEEYYILNK